MVEIENKIAMEISVSEALRSIPMRERKAIEMRFGLNGETPHTYREIGVELNVCGGRARQIIMKGMRRLKHPSRSKKLKGL